MTKITTVTNITRITSITFITRITSITIISPSTLSKALEWCILLQFSDHLSTSELQFGFKQHLSASICTGSVKNIASRYIHRGSHVYACFLDASKAFNSVKHDTLFKRLLEKGLPAPLLRLLMSWYTSQAARVHWGDSLSAPFSVSNGVHQGGVLYPVLFTIYVDDLLLNLRRLGIGCFWNSLFAGALCYADDLVLLAPSPSALRLQLQCCEQFALSHAIKFNASKTQLIRFGLAPSCSCRTRISFLGQLLPFQNSVCHLGHLISSDLSDSEDINLKAREMTRKANCILASFPCVGPVILTRLFQSFCLSLYGCAFWSLSCKTLGTIEVAINNILRRIWHLPRLTHTRILHLTTNLSSVFNIVRQRSL